MEIFAVVLAVTIAVPVVLFAVLSALAVKPTNLGVKEGKLADCPASPNCVSTQCNDDQHRIEPLVFEGTPQEAMARLKGAISKMPRLKIETETENYIHAEATSLIFRFVDDVEFYVDSGAKVIHFRSASRIGHGDLGVNRARMERLREAFR